MKIKVNGKPIDARRLDQAAEAPTPPWRRQREEGRVAQSSVVGSGGAPGRAGHDGTVADPSKGCTVGELLDGLRRAGHLPRGQVVTRLELDGRPWPAPGVANPRDVSLEHVSDVAVETSGTRGYAKLVLDDLPDTLDALVRGAATTARSFRVGSVSHANRNLLLLLDAVQSFLACLYQIGSACDLPGQPLGQDSPTLQRLNASLDGIEHSQTREDWRSLVQQLEGELAVALGDFSGVIAEMSAGVDHGRRG